VNVPADSGLADSADAPGRDEADAADREDAPDTAPPPGDVALFVGNWSPVTGIGQSNCDGQITSLTPNTNAILTFTQSGPDMLTATSSGAAGCSLQLVVTGETASLAQPTETCSSNQGPVSFDTFTLTFTPSGEGGAPSEGGSAEGTLDWELGDSRANCVTTLHYTLARAQ
jgi:hypothetical protein